MRRGIALVGMAAVVAAATWLVRPPAADRERPAPAPPATVEVATAGVVGPDHGREREIDRLIAHYEDQLRTQSSTLDLTMLGRLYLERGRLTGDVGAYARAEEALVEALAIAPRDADARALLASVRFTMHDFGGALELAEGLLSEDPGDLGALAVAGDARLELGDYAGAGAAYRRLADALPGAAAVEVRRARLAFLMGDAGTARHLASEAERSAVRAGVGGPDLAWYRSFRAQLELDTGRYREAGRLWASAVRLAPDSPPALAGLGRALAATGRLDEAIRRTARSAELLPDPAVLSTLGDLYAIRGHGALARAQYDTVEAIAALARADRGVYDRQLATFYADHDRDVDRALEIAEGELEVRKDVYGWDVYAWALYRAGRYADARVAADRALGLGTPDPRLHYHAGMIELALGDTAHAADMLRMALELGPAFDPIHAPLAARTLRALRS